MHYPTAVEQAYAVAQYVATHGAEFNIDANKLAVAGDSVGGNMAAVLTFLAKERGGPHFTYQALFYPVTDANFNTESYRQFADGYWLSMNSMRWFWDAYAPKGVNRNNPLVSPLRASLSQLHGLPAALVITDENDVLRDEGEAYAHKLMQAGVPVTGVRFLGAIHDFMILDPLKNTLPTRGAIDFATQQIRKALAR